MKIEMRDIGSVQPYEGNPRINDQAVEAVAASIKEFGFRQDEIWAPIPGYEGLYEVSSFGRVRRATKSRTAPAGYILKSRLSWDGYVKYSLFKAGRYWHTKGHRLVALAFLGPPPFAGAHVAHQDGVRTNNRVSNLRWATPAENEADKRRHGTAVGAQPGERHHQARLTAHIVAKMRRRVAAGETMAAVARRFGVAKVTAYDAIVGKTWQSVKQPMPLQRKRRTTR
ncbi:MAG: NUMOD4 domain-containing protein [Planctomycetota bacterium]